MSYCHCSIRLTIIFGQNSSFSVPSYSVWFTDYFLFQSQVVKTYSFVINRSYIPKTTRQWKARKKKSLIFFPLFEREISLYIYFALPLTTRKLENKEPYCLKNVDTGDHTSHVPNSSTPFARTSLLKHKQFEIILVLSQALIIKTR